jgi:hypothetical protein
VVKYESGQIFQNGTEDLPENTPSYSLTFHENSLATQRTSKVF